MIIKSMSRKEASFGQLVAYVSRDAADRRFDVHHNVLGQDQTALVAEFEANGQLLQKRKNGVVMYHEIISITRAKSVSEAHQKEALRSIALDYIKRRAPQALVYGSLHNDRKDQLHYHLVISANNFGEQSRLRLSKAEFRDIQVSLEQQVLVRHPELEQTLAIGKRAKPRDLSQSGVELKRRTGATPQKQSVKAKAVSIFGAVQSPDDLFKQLTDARLELYRRGKSIGLRDLATGRTHRLATLGVDEAFKSMSEKFEMKKQNDDQNQQSGQQGGAGTTTKHDTPQARALTAGLLPNVVGGIAKESTGMIEIAVHQAGGPKPFEPSAKREVREVKEALSQRPTPTPPSPAQNAAAEVEKLRQARLTEMTQLLDAQEKHQSQNTNRLKR